MTPFTFRPYQREDLARSALMPGVVFSWEQGLGKTLAAFAWPMLKGARNVLIVAPGGLHAQIIREGREKFGVTVRRLPDIDTALADDDLRSRILTPSQPNQEPGTKNQELLSPLFYLTSYTELGMNGADERPLEIRGDTLFLADNAQKLRRATAPDTDPLAGAWDGVGENRHGITCVHRPSLSTIVQAAFDCVVCDEATRMKGDTTYLSEGVRRTTPAYRLVLTGTPVKNRLPDLFWLAHWAAGGHPEPTARWPYGDQPGDKALFGAEHLVSERNLTKEALAAASGRRRTYKKQTAEICGLHRLWKLLGPIVLRRRKADVGADLVAKRIIPMRVPMGRQQAATYRWHLLNPPEYTKAGDEMNPLAAIATQLSFLRQAALCPDSPGIAIAGKSGFTPKNLATLQIVRECLDRAEPVVIFSPFQHYSAWLTATLTAAGVDTVCLDGNVTPARRGQLAAEFKAGKYPVLVAGLKSMGEGHSFDHCPNLILPGLEWAYDANAQAIERVHRLTSRKDVRIYTLIAEGTIDERLASLFNEKTDAADLALDGQLFKPEVEEINLFELLQRALADFDPDAKTVPEDEIQADYASHLRPALHDAYLAWRSGHPAEPANEPKPKPEPPEPKPDDYRAHFWRCSRTGELVYEAYLKVPGAVKHTVFRDWDKAHLEHLTEIQRDHYLRNYLSSLDWDSPRPYQLGQSCDGSINGCVYALFEHWCSAFGHDPAELYHSAYPDEDRRAYSPGGHDLADWQGVAYPAQWDEAAFNGLMESFTNINHHSLRSYLEDEFQGTRFTDDPTPAPSFDIPFPLHPTRHPENQELRTKNQEPRTLMFPTDPTRHPKPSTSPSDRVNIIPITSSPDFTHRHPEPDPATEEKPARRFLFPGRDGTMISLN